MAILLVLLLLALEKKQLSKIRSTKNMQHCAWELVDILASFVLLSCARFKHLFFEKPQRKKRWAQAQILEGYVSF